MDRHTLKLTVQGGDIWDAPDEILVDPLKDMIPGIGLERFPLRLAQYFAFKLLFLAQSEYQVRADASEIKRRTGEYPRGYEEIDWEDVRYEKVSQLIYLCREVMSKKYENNSTFRNNRNQIQKYIEAYKIDSRALERVLEKTNPVDPQCLGIFSTLCSRFNKGLSVETKDVTDKVKEAEDEQYRKRKEADTVEINPCPQLERAHRILQMVESGEIENTSYNWKDVSIALSLVTGRRMKEIHQTARFFEVSETEYINDFVWTLNSSKPPIQNVARFTGQVKGGRARLKESNYITCLVPTRLVIAGLEYLETYRAPNQRKGTVGMRIKMTEKNPRAVNDRFSKGLSDHIDTVAAWHIEGLIRKNSDATLTDDEKELLEQTYHKARAMYVAVLMKWAKMESGIDTPQWTEGAKRLICDKSDKAATHYSRYRVVGDNPVLMWID